MKLLLVALLSFSNPIHTSTTTLSAEEAGVLVEQVLRELEICAAHQAIDRAELRDLRSTLAQVEAEKRSMEHSVIWGSVIGGVVLAALAGIVIGASQ